MSNKQKKHPKTEAPEKPEHSEPNTPESISIAEEVVNVSFAPQNDEVQQRLERELKEAKDQVLRSLAEMENVRKRAERDVEEAAKYAVTKFATDMINVLENLYRAEESIKPELLDAHPELKNFVQGIQLTKNDVIASFEKHGLRRIFPKGEAFNTAQHQVIMEVEDANTPAGSIVNVAQAGYMLKDRLLRPAMVIVAKTSSSNS